MFYLQLQVHQCIAEVILNGIPLRRLDSRDQKFANVIAHSFLIAGRNQLELVVFPGATPNTSKINHRVGQASGAWARTRLVRFQVGDLADYESGETLMEIKWAGGQPQEAFPRVLKTDALVNSNFGGWSWQSSEVLALPRDLRPVTEILHFIHKAFSDGQPDSIIKLARVFLDEETRSLPAYAPGELAASLSKSISENAGRNWVAELNEPLFDLRLCAENRLIECLDRNWQPRIRTKPQANGDEYKLPLFLGRMRGEWLIIR